MRIYPTNNNNNYSVNFGALRVAQITSRINKEETTFIYRIEKNKDFDFCRMLKNRLIQSNPERMQVSNPNIKNFVRSAFDSFAISDYSAIGVRNNKPFGLLSILSNNSDNEAHLKYLLTWKTPDLTKIKNGGRDLINFIFNKYENKNSINLTPAFDSEIFYYKFGFDFENEYERDQMSIYSKDIKTQLRELLDKFTYKNIEDSNSEDLSKIVTLD